MSANKSWIPWVILVILSLTWGSSFILIKRSLEVFSPGEVGALRTTIAWLFLMPFALKRMRGHSTREWGLFLVVGMVGSLIPAFLFAAAQVGIDSSLAGILNSLTPLFTLLIGLVFFRIRPTWFNIAGVFLGLAGAIGLVSVSGTGNFAVNMFYAALIIIAALCYAVNVNTIKAFLQKVNSITLTSLAFFTVGPIALGYLLIFTPFTTTLTSEPHALKGLGYLTILAIVGTGLALMLFNHVIQLTSAVFASSVTYFVPIVALLWGIADGEHFKPGFIVWVLMVIAGVLLVNTKSLKKYRVYRWITGAG
ncbi:MAG: DMT family transporter [Lentimicrobium sp.]|jgi:drug/metabolite transporter (DMT)-like permease|nr:DMT family transporter [Lentimicrobium sp.]